MRRILGWAASGAGMLLLVVSFLGHFTSLGDYTSVEPRAWEAFDPELAASIRNWGELSTEAGRRVQAAGGGRA